VTRQIALTLAVTAGALALFVSNRLRVDLIGLLVMTALIVLGLVTPRQGISGFANEATVTVALMLVLSAGLLRTGAVDLLGRWTGRLAGTSELRLLVVVIAVIVPVSAFINNTAAVAILLPVVLGLSRARRIAASRILMPLSFAGQMGGTLTLIGTSTNLLVAGLLVEEGVARLGLFDVTPPAVVLTALGAVYLLTVGRWLTPTRTPAEGLAESYHLREYLTALEVAPGSRIVGRSLQEARVGRDLGLQVVEVRRGTARLREPDRTTVVEAGDVLVVTASVSHIADIAESDSLRIVGAAPPAALAAVGDELATTAEGVKLAELLVPVGSAVVGRTLKEIDFRARSGVTALAIQRHGHLVGAPVANVPLAGGDLLLVRGPARRLRLLHEAGEFALLGTVRVPAKRRRKMARAVAIMAGVVLLPALGITTILISSLLGVAAMLLTGCITPDEAYEEMDWSVIVLLGSILPLGLAMRDTGAAHWVSDGLLGLTSSLGAHGALLTFYVIATLLTSVISNNAAAVVLVPVAVESAASLGLSPMPFVIAVMFAASSSFVTPIGYQTNTFIFGPGGYRFGDFARVGAPLNVLLAAASTFVIPYFFPF
jgi:di/tricarboxylate transporter